MPEKIAAGLDEIRRAYPPAEAHRILESAFNMLADEGENRGGLLSTEDLLIFIQTARD